MHATRKLYHMASLWIPFHNNGVSILEAAEKLGILSRQNKRLSM